MTNKYGLTELTLTDLDNLRAEIMMALLTREGREEIWKYDIIARDDAAREALARQNYDNIEAARTHADKPYALVGPGIDDCYFSTVAELASILFWVCQKCLGGTLAVKPDDTYANQQEVLAERNSFPFIPLRTPGARKAEDKNLLPDLLAMLTRICPNDYTFNSGVPVKELRALIERAQATVQGL